MVMRSPNERNRAFIDLDRYQLPTLVAIAVWDTVLLGVAAQHVERTELGYAGTPFWTSCGLVNGELYAGIESPYCPVSAAR